MSLAVAVAVAVTVTVTITITEVIDAMEAMEANTR